MQDKYPRRANESPSNGQSLALYLRKYVTAFPHWRLIRSWHRHNVLS